MKLQFLRYCVKYCIDNKILIYMFSNLLELNLLLHLTLASFIGITLQYQIEVIPITLPKKEVTRSRVVKIVELNLQDNTMNI